MISPFRIGILFTKPIALRERAFKLKMPMAAMLCTFDNLTLDLCQGCHHLFFCFRKPFSNMPNKVDAVAASSAMVMVLTRAFIRE